MATILFTLGWTLLLLDTKINGYSTTDRAEPYLQLLMPDPTLAGMAFLGSYFFALQFILRSFIRGDLRPKSYSTIAARVVAGVTVAYVVGVVASAQKNETLLVVAFFAGYVPDTVLRRVANLANDFVPALGRDLDANELDLKEISGMDIYAKTKLFSEGITNVETLAHTDPIDLLARTRFPAAELIDWIDQAILLIHLPRCTTRNTARGKGKVKRRRKATVALDLSCLGVRTATNLVFLMKECDYQPLLRRHFGAEADEVEISLRGVLWNLEQEPVLLNLQAWRASTTVGLGQELPELLRDPAVRGTEWDQPWIDRVSIRSRHRRFDLRNRWIEHSGGRSAPGPLG